MAYTISDVMRLLPPGFRFHATDEELLTHYLKPKILGQHDQDYHNILPELDICEFEPWQLPNIVGETFNGKELFLYCRMKRKYSNSKRSDRTTKAGYWKVTGKERAIMSEDTNAQIGIKKTLVFYEGRVPKGKRTDWVMHEYNLNPKCLGNNQNEHEMLPYVACRIKNKRDKKLMKGYAPTISPEDYSSSPHTSTGSVSETLVNQGADNQSFCNTPNNEVAVNPEAVDPQPESQRNSLVFDGKTMSEGDLLETLPPLGTLDDYVSDYVSTPTYQPQAGAEEGSSSFFDFCYNNNSNEFDNGYVPSPYSNSAYYSGLAWGNV